MDLEKIEMSQHETISAAPEPTEMEPVKSTPKESIRLDKHGLPLVPQPTIHKDDPLNWSSTRKLAVALQISFLAMLGPMGSAVANPAFVPLSKSFHLTVVAASYELTVFLVSAGIGPFAVVPFANCYGRRPVYLIGNLLAAITNIAAGYCNTWGGLMTTRFFNGLGAGSSIAIGAATICDMYFQHERGLYMGIYTFFLTNGAHLASLLGGFIAQYKGWRACFYIPGYIQLGVFVVTVFCLPETLYSRDDDSTSAPYKELSYIDLLLLKRSFASTRRPRFRDFTRPLEMMRCISVILPALFYMTCFAYGSVLFALTGAKLFAQYYDFNLAQTGLLLSVPLLIGCLIGELNAGWVTDWFANRHAQKNNGERLPEARLNAIWGALLIPVGVIIEGVCLSHTKTVGWIGTAFGMGIANLGLQIATTVVYTYTTDCYKPQSAEISTLLNAFRQIFSCFVSFYALPLGEKIQIQYAWLVFALINIIFLIPVLMLRVFGKRWRSLPSQVLQVSS